ncbi:MAG: hypothetical protein GF331_01135 [Chitinivibrionales bacterium]|nr:hypothetical protein [Chitinivibrionales bacterium]
MTRKSFVGFGFGPIQSGLMLYEAARSGNFESFVVAEVDQELVDAVREAGDRVAVNIARRDRITTETLEGIVLCNPRVDADRRRLVDAIAGADEMATAVPSVKLYTAGGDSSIAALLAQAVDGHKPQVLYACENNNYAAEALRGEILAHTAEDALGRLHILDTVIGKMSGVIRDPAEIERLNLTPLTPSLPRAILVEEFNRILVSKVKPGGPQRGITPFVEKDDLLPFEEAKLFGHNAVHSLLGYLAAAKGHRVMSSIRDDADLYGIGMRAFMDECGPALIAKHGTVGDALFTEDGWREYASDLLERMTNPFLYDSVERICRDPRRKLGYGDRLFGTMRVCLCQNVKPQLLARGARAGLAYMGRADVEDALAELWDGEADDGLMGECVRLVREAKA